MFAEKLLTFVLAPLDILSAQTLGEQLLGFFLAPLELLHSLIMIINCDTQDLLCTLLSDNELIQILLQ
jgi:hypothetical protein